MGEGCIYGEARSCRLSCFLGVRDDKKSRSSVMRAIELTEETASRAGITDDLAFDTLAASIYGNTTSSNEASAQA